MTIKSEKFTISTKGFDDIIDITSKVQNIVSSFPEQNGLINIMVNASTASVLTLEYEPGLVLDLPRMLDSIVPLNKVYIHDGTWHEGNAHAHLRAALLGNNITLSVFNKKIELSNWQKIILIDFDNKPRIRQIIVSIVS